MTSPTETDPLAGGRRLLPRMRPRDPHEVGRAASPLELFFDLVFVVAVSLSSQALHHLESEGHVATGALSYLMVFFAIWWAWMNFTWFATSFATDDWLYRLMTILQMGGVLVLASGAEAAMVHYDFTLVTIGYVVMRLALVGQWLRASRSHPDLRNTAYRYAGGIVAVQVAWVGRLFLPETAGFGGFFILVAAEVLIPVWAERCGTTPWNPHHVRERYGLFTLILLGESILAATNAILEALHEGHHIPDLIGIAACGLIIAAGMWWIYFAHEHQHQPGLGGSLLFGYFHYVIFAAAGAFSAGIEVTIDATTRHTDLPAVLAAGTLTLPIALFIGSVWWLTLRHGLTNIGSITVACGVLATLAATLIPGLVVLGSAIGTIIAVIASETCRTVAVHG
ncbi:low temperature requirement protein A [Curtobacterium sp. MCJR17_020]|uniref:low temperature requirement protein A n=1 Tax=Curtobacterium sp. MCJR17_020 TaxID=2175619 RepID=UPI0021AD01A6|nr:low temperature requirement protein A [Curtobacterium sp. MCJR17_020]WIE74084.1 low temperature requirement protein A [Curtobacterium sp. MCJR17_020]